MADYRSRPTPKQRSKPNYGNTSINIGGPIGFSQPMHLSTANMYDSLTQEDYYSSGTQRGSLPDTSGLPGCVRHRNEIVTEKQRVKDTKLPKLLYDLDEACMNGANAEEKTELAFLILHAASSPIRKYRILQFFKLLDNNKEEASVQKVNDALVILEKYAINLLKYEKYPHWRVVKFHLSIIQNQVFPVKGADDVLKQMGYTQVTANAFTFPNDVTKPDVQGTVVLASDLVIARVEMDTLLNNGHPFLIFALKTSQIDQSSLAVKLERGTGSVSPTEAGVCGVCCKQNVAMLCKECSMQFCEECDDRWHSHKQRCSHFRINLLIPGTHKDKSEKDKTERPVPVPRRRKVQQPDKEVAPVTSQQPILTQPGKMSPVVSNNIYSSNQEIKHPPSRYGSSPGIGLPVNASHSPQRNVLFNSALSTGDLTLAKMKLITEGNIVTTQRNQGSSFMDEKSRQVSQPQNISPQHLAAVGETASSCSNCHLLVSSKQPFCPSCKHQLVKDSSRNLSPYGMAPTAPSQVYGSNNPLKTSQDVGQLRSALYDTPVSHQSLANRKLPDLPAASSTTSFASPADIAMPEPLYEEVLSMQTQVNQSKDVWSCEHCTFVNPMTTKVCQLCCKTPSDMKYHPSFTGKVPQNGPSNSANQLPLRKKTGEGTDPGVPVTSYATVQHPPDGPLYTYMTPKTLPLEGGIFMVPNTVPNEPPHLPKKKLASGNIKAGEPGGLVEDAQKSREHELSEKEKGKRLAMLRLQQWESGQITEDEYYNPDLEKERRFSTARLNEPQLNRESVMCDDEVKQLLQSSVIAQEDIYNNYFINIVEKANTPKLASEEEISLTNEQIEKLLQDDMFSQEGIHNILPTVNVQPQTPSEPEVLPLAGSKLSHDELQQLYDVGIITRETFNNMRLRERQISNNQVYQVPKVEPYPAAKQAPEADIQAMFEEFHLLEMHRDYKSGNVLNYRDVGLNKTTFHDSQNFHVTANVMPNLYDKIFSKNPDMPASIAKGNSNFLSLPNYLEENLETYNYIEDQSRLYIEWMKEAEGQGFTPEELNLATNLSWQDHKGRNPVEWLKEEWTSRLAEVIGKVTELTGNENDRIGNLSTEEAKEALLENDGSVESACKSCIESRREKLAKMSEIAGFGRTDCLNALDENNGDMDKAILELEQKLLEPIRKRVLGNEDGVEGGERNMDDGEMYRKFVAMVANKNVTQERRVRVVFAEKRMVSWGRAETAVKLIDMDFSVEDAIEAADAYGDLERSLVYLKQECPVCLDTQPMGQMITFLCCQDRICKECVANHLTFLIKERNIHNIVCPVCGLPDLCDDAEATEYFNNLDIMMRQIVEKDVHDLFQQKLRDRTLRKEPNFRWCAHCDYGFINEAPDINRMMCIVCKKHTCFNCKKPWELQHEGISCEQFARWQEQNDEEFQVQGLAGHLARFGIDCPECKFRYDLAKGGCMHFKCIQCSHEFCSGCYGPFKHGAKCAVSESCARKGIHAHHPRDCLFYLRDWTPDRLQGLLDGYGVDYNTEPVQEEEIPGDGAAPLCKVMEQKETPNGLEDAECGFPCVAGHPLCKLHYTEYLVSLIKRNGIDPADVMDGEEMSTVLRRVEIEPPAREPGEDENLYKERILNILKDRLPLRRPDVEVLEEEEYEEEPVLV